MNVIELLTRDHETMLELVDQLDGLKDQPEKNRNKIEKLFARLKSDLEMHTTAEEQFFYPELKDEEETRDLIMKALTDHQTIRSALTELDKGRMDDAWFSRFSEMKDNVQNHIEEEESDLFEMALEILDEDEIDMIGDSIYQLKKAA